MIKPVKSKICLLICTCFMMAACGRDEDVYVLSQDRESMAGPVTCEAAMDGEDVSTETNIYVHVCGAVNSSGVVCIPEGSRVFEAIKAAGGLTPEADTLRVNLAAGLTDGERLYIPTQGEEPEPTQQSLSDGRVNINTADEGQLCDLPGIGRSRAADIVAYREAHGDFREEEDIMKVSGIKNSTYEKLKNRIKVR